MNIDPRSKMLIVVCLTGLALMYDTPRQLLLLFLAAIALLFIFRFDIRTIAGYFRPFLSLLLFLFIIQTIFVPGGEVLLGVRHTPLITSGGLATAASVVLRIAVIAAAAMLLMTFNSRDFILGLVQWKVPFELAFMVAITLRYLPLFRDELLTVVTAIQLRGVELKRVPWGEKIALQRSLIFPVVYRTMLQAQQLAVAIEARGFRAYPHRTYIRRLRFYWADYAVISLSLLTTIALVVQHMA